MVTIIRICYFYISIWGLTMFYFNDNESEKKTDLMFGLYLMRISLEDSISK